MYTKKSYLTNCETNSLEVLKLLFNVLYSIPPKFKIIYLKNNNNNNKIKI